MSSPRARAADCDDLTVADVMHATFTTLSPAAKVRDANAWFGRGARRRLALVADRDGRYVGLLTPADVAGAPPDRPARELARPGITLAPDDAAAAGRDLVRAGGVGRAPVVDRDGRLVGVLALTSDEQYFSCRSGAA